MTRRRLALISVLCTCLPNLAAQSGFESLAKYPSEAAAAARGEELGIGVAEFVESSQVTVAQYAQVKLRFTVGKAGMATGGGLRLSTQHDFQWNMWGGTMLQTRSPSAPNFFTYRTSSGAALKWEYLPNADGYFPWQHVNQFILTGASLSEGDFIELVFGDKSAGSPGVLIQPIDETAFEQKVYVDVFGEGEFLPLKNSPQLSIVGGEPKELIVIAPTDWEVGKARWVNVWVDDGLGNPAVSYRGTVTLEDPAGQGNLPQPHAYVEQDRGAYRFAGVSFDRPGTYRIVARDRDGRESTSNPIVVHQELPRQTIVWGDLHTHTKYSDGRGSPDELYDFGKRYAALDFCAVSDHAFITTPEMWRDIQRATKEFNEPGNYVTFLGYEWSGPSDVGGDHNVYTTDDEMPLIRSYLRYRYENYRNYHGPQRQAGHVEDLFRMLAENFRDENLLTIPHFGGRPGNPTWHNNKLQRGIEVFSDHRRSEDWVATFLEKGHRVGVVASTDNHSGNAGYGIRRQSVARGADGALYSRYSPTERGTALMAVLADDLDREGVFQGIYHRRTYATTGERIVLRFEVADEPLGSEIRAGENISLKVSAAGTAGLKTVRVVKSGEIIYSVDPPGEQTDFEFVDRDANGESAYYYVDLVQDDGEKAISSPVWVN